MTKKLPFIQKFSATLALLALLVMPGVGWGQTDFTATYTFGSNGNVSSFTYNGTTYDGISMGTLNKVGVTTSSSTGNFRATGWPTGATNGSDVFTGIVNTGYYIGFTIDAVSGYKFTVTSITFGIGRSGTGTRQSQWRGNNDSFGSILPTYSNVASGLTNVSGVLTNTDANSNWTGNILTVGPDYSEITTSCGFRMYMYNSEATSGSGGISGPITISGTYELAASTPTLTATPTTLTGFTYVDGAGPSTEQTFTVSGANLTEDISIAASTNYEISKTAGSDYTSPLTFTPAEAATPQTIYVRLKAGLSAGSYSSEVINITSTGADAKTVTCSGAVLDQIDWCNLQSPFTGNHTLGNSFDVYGQVYAVGITEAAGQGAGITAWVGYSTENTNPDTWTNWVAASFNVQAGNNDEYKADLGAALTIAGTYYYAYRYQLGTAPYVYGGTGGFWTGAGSNSGTLTAAAPVYQLDWVNLQSPSTGTITAGGTFNVYAQVYESGLTETPGQGSGIDAWIGYSTQNTDPATWTNWVVASFNTQSGNNDEYIADIAAGLPAGTYYYASRFKYNAAEYVYGGYLAGSGGFWDGNTNVSGILTVEVPAIIINEVDADTPGTDILEFIELFDGGTGNTPLSGFVVVLFNGNGDISYAAYDLDGYSTDANGYFVIGSTGMGTQIEIAPGSSGWLQNGADAVALYTANGTDFPNSTALSIPNLIDAVVYDTDDADDTGLLVLLNTSQPQVNENMSGNMANHSVQRLPNGSGGARNTNSYNATHPTPGAANNYLTLTWTGATNSDWNTLTNWSTSLLPDAGVYTVIPDVTNNPVISGVAACKDLTIGTSASLQIASTGSLTVSGTLTTNNALTIENGASLITQGAIIGEATVNKTISGTTFHLFTLPVNESVVAMPLFEGYYVDGYIEANGEWTRLVDANALSPLTGYSIANESGSASLSFTGNLFTGNQAFTNLSYTPAATGYLYGWNLIGNPFPSAIDLDLSPFTNAGLNGFVYVWNGSNFVSGPLAGGTGTLTGNVIPASQGFFVRTTNATNSLLLPQTSRVHSSQAFYKNAQEYTNVIGLKVIGNNAEDNMLFVINPQATAGFDQQYDAYKLFGNADAPQLYTVVGNENTSISAFQSVESTTELPVMLKVGASGEYSLTAGHLDTFLEGTIVYLNDNLTGLRQDLRQHPVYTFNASTGDDVNRFKLSFATVGISENPILNIGIYAAGNEIRLQLPEVTRGTVVISSLDGRILNNTRFNGAGEVSVRTHVSSGIYLVTVTTEKGTLSRKVLVN